MRRMRGRMMSRRRRWMIGGVGEGEVVVGVGPRRRGRGK